MTLRFSIAATLQNPSHMESNTQSRLSNGSSMFPPARSKLPRLSQRIFGDIRTELSPSGFWRDSPTNTPATERSGGGRSAWLPSNNSHAYH